MKKKIKIIKVEGTPEWMISFGDLMSCLLVFFILLLTFSSTKPGQVMDMMESSYDEGGNIDSRIVQDGDQPGAGGKGERVEVLPEDEAAFKLTNLLIAQRYGEFQKLIYEMGFKHEISVKNSAEGLLFEMKTSDIFTTEVSSELAPTSKIPLQAMGNAAFSMKRDFIMTSMPKVRERALLSTLLATAEAQTQVLRNMFVNKYKIPSELLSIGINFHKDQEDMFKFLICADKPK